MMATNSPFFTTKSIPFSTRVSSGPSLNVFTRFLISIMEISIASKNGIQCVPAHNHARRQIPGNDCREDEEPNASHRSARRRDEDAVAEREGNRVCRNRGHQDAVEHHEAYGRTDDRVKERLENIGNLYCL